MYNAMLQNEQNPGEVLLMFFWMWRRKDTEGGRNCRGEGEGRKILPDPGANTLQQPRALVRSSGQMASIGKDEFEKNDKPSKSLVSAVPVYFQLFNVLKYFGKN